MKELLGLFKNVGWAMVNQLMILNDYKQYGQYWTARTAAAIAAGATSTLTMPDRDFDFDIRGIAIYAWNASGFAALNGVTVLPSVGQTQLFQTAVSTSLFIPQGGTFVKIAKPIVARNTEQIKFQLTNNESGITAFVDVLLYGYRSEASIAPTNRVKEYLSKTN